MADECGGCRIRERFMEEFAALVRETYGPGTAAWRMAVQMEHMLKTWREKR